MISALSMKGNGITSYHITAYYNKKGELMDVEPKISRTEGFLINTENEPVLRYSNLMTPQYYQVFVHKHGFVPDLSIIDLIFNLGPESVLYLEKLK